MIKVCKDDTAAKMLRILTQSFSCITGEDELPRIMKEKEPKCEGEHFSYVKFERKDSPGWKETLFWAE